MMILYLELWKYIGYIYKKSAITVQSRKRFMNGFLLNPILFQHNERENELCKE